MEKKYKVLEEYEVEESNHSPSFSTKEEAIEYATKHLGAYQVSKKYIAKVETSVSNIMPKLETKVEEL